MINKPFTNARLYCVDLQFDDDFSRCALRMGCVLGFSLSPATKTSESRKHLAIYLFYLDAQSLLLRFIKF
jgi:hypothetical protein